MGGIAEMFKPRFPVYETFVSIEGEGPRAGLLTTFVRFAGCNLDCSFCDTKYANEADTPTVMHTLYSLMDIIKHHGVRTVSLTGGEPMMQPRIFELIDTLLDNDFFVSMETNGSIPLTGLRSNVLVVMDIKSPSSGMSKRMHYENLGVLDMYDAVKFVVGDLNDLQNMVNVLYAYPTEANIYVSPVFGKIELKTIAEFLTRMNAQNIRMQVQLHKIIWDPEAKGV